MQKLKEIYIPVSFPGIVPTIILLYYSVHDVQQHKGVNIW